LRVNNIWLSVTQLTGLKNMTHVSKEACRKIQSSLQYCNRNKIDILTEMQVLVWLVHTCTIFIFCSYCWVWENWMVPTPDWK